MIVVKPYAYIHSYAFLNVMSWWMIFSARRYATTINYENFARVVYGRVVFRSPFALRDPDVGFTAFNGLKIYLFTLV